MSKGELDEGEKELSRALPMLEGEGGPGQPRHRAGEERLGAGPLLEGRGRAGREERARRLRDLPTGAGRRPCPDGPASAQPRRPPRRDRPARRVGKGVPRLPGCSHEAARARPREPRLQLCEPRRPSGTARQESGSGGALQALAGGSAQDARAESPDAGSDSSADGTLLPEPGPPRRVGEELRGSARALSGDQPQALRGRQVPERVRPHRRRAAASTPRRKRR